MTKIPIDNVVEEGRGIVHILAECLASFEVDDNKKSRSGAYQANASIMRAYLIFPLLEKWEKNPSYKKVVTCFILLIGSSPWEEEQNKCCA